MLFVFDKHVMVTDDMFEILSLFKELKLLFPKLVAVTALRFVDVLLQLEHPVTNDKIFLFKKTLLR